MGDAGLTYFKTVKSFFFLIYSIVNDMPPTYCPQETYLESDVVVDGKR